MFAPVYDNLGNEIIEAKCPFCRTPAPYSDEEYNERLQKRVVLDDAEAIFMLGSNYDEGRYGSPQDYEKSLELFVRAGDLGCAEAYNNVGYAYENGNGTETDKKKKAKYFFELAAIGGNIGARYNLGCSEVHVGNYERALKHL